MPAKRCLFKNCASSSFLRKLILIVSAITMLTMASGGPTFSNVRHRKALANTKHSSPSSPLGRVFSNSSPGVDLTESEEFEIEHSRHEMVAILDTTDIISPIFYSYKKLPQNIPAPVSFTNHIHCGLSPPANLFV